MATTSIETQCRSSQQDNPELRLPSPDEKAVVIKKEDDDEAASRTAPSCGVCGDEASGMHYRALTCEGCKTFFRRNVKKRDRLVCEMDDKGNCVINTYLRRHCAFCRMKKCLLVGMRVDRVWDKDRIKTRKPIVKKQKQQVMPPTEKDGSSPTTTIAPSSTSTPEEDTAAMLYELPSETQFMIEFIGKAFQNANKRRGTMTGGIIEPNPNKEFLIENLSSCKDPVTSPSDPRIKDIFPARAVEQHSQDEEEMTRAEGRAGGQSSKPGINSKEAESSPCSHDNKHTVSQSAPRLPLGRERAAPGAPASPSDSSKVTLTSPSPVGDEARKACGSDHSTVPDGADTHKTNLPGCRGDEKTTDTKTPGNTSEEAAAAGATASSSSFLKINPVMSQYIMQMSVTILRNMIAFAKQLPRFNAFSWAAQASLIKGGFIEYIFLHAARLYDPANKRFNSAFIPGTGYDHAACERAGMGSAFNEAVVIAEKLTEINLNADETAILYALSIMSSDRPGIEAVSKVEISDVQDKLAEALRLSLLHKTNGNTSVFPKAIMLLTHLRKATEIYRSDVMQIELQSHVITPLLEELFDNPE